MRYHFFLQYGWFFQNLGKEGWRTFMHTTVHTIIPNFHNLKLKVFKYVKISSICKQSKLFSLCIWQHLATPTCFVKKGFPLFLHIFYSKKKMNSSNCRYSTRQVNLKVINYFRYCLPDGNTIIFCASFKYVFFLYKKEILIRYAAF